MWIHVKSKDFIWIHEIKKFVKSKLSILQKNKLRHWEPYRNIRFYSVFYKMALLLLLQHRRSCRDSKWLVTSQLETVSLFLYNLWWIVCTWLEGCRSFCWRAREFSVKKNSESMKNIPNYVFEFQNPERINFRTDK